MSSQQQPSAADGIGIGIAFMATGAYFILVGFGVLPVPGGQDAVHGPAAVIVAAGAAFLFAGVAAAIRAKSGAADRDNDLPAESSAIAHAAYRIAGIAVAGSLAAIGTWIAIGAGPRAFTISAPMFEMRTTGEMIGRTVFGLGAVVVWIYVIALTVQTVRKLFGRRG